MYLTRPWGYEDQPEFVNAVAQLDTHLSPQELLAKAKAIELSLGRRETFRWGPREIDIDILLYGDRVVRNDDLAIPHPLICKRAFVLAPLVDIAPDLIHPVTGLRMSDHLEEIRKREGCTWRNLNI